MSSSLSPLLLSCLLVLLTGDHARAVTTHPGDMAAMQVLACSLGAKNMLGWGKSSPDPCNGRWSGVHCTGDGRVNTILVSNAGLNRSLHQALNSLTFLQTLDLRFNSIGGALPYIPALTQPVTLELRSNCFTAIPANFFAGLTALGFFSIDNKPLTSWNLQSLHGARHLDRFSADSAGISGILPTNLPQSLHTLSLANNHLTGPIDPVANIVSLRFLHLEHNSFSGLLPDFSRIEAAEVLNLSNNQLTGSIPPSTANIPTLRILNVLNNKLCGTVPKFSHNVAVNVDRNPNIGKPC